MSPKETAQADALVDTSSSNSTVAPAEQTPTVEQPSAAVQSEAVAAAAAATATDPQPQVVQQQVPVESATSIEMSPTAEAAKQQSSMDTS